MRRPATQVRQRRSDQRDQRRNANGDAHGCGCEELSPGVPGRPAARGPSARAYARRNVLVRDHASNLGVGPFRGGRRRDVGGARNDDRAQVTGTDRAGAGVRDGAARGGRRARGGLLRRTGVLVSGCRGVPMRERLFTDAWLRGLRRLRGRRRLGCNRGRRSRVRHGRRSCRSSHHRRRGLRGGARARVGARRQEVQRVHVSLLIRGHAQPEVHECVGTRGADNVALRDLRPARHRDRPEVEERRGVSGRRLDRDRLPAVRDRARERDRPLGGGVHRRALACADVDSPMLSPGIRMRRVEHVRPQHRPVDRPCPCLRGCRKRKGAQQKNHDSAHGNLLVVRSANSDRRYRRDLSLSILATKYGDKARFAKHRSASRRSPPSGGATNRRRRAPRPRPPRRPGLRTIRVPVR